MGEGSEEVRAGTARPVSVVWFERLAWAQVAVGTVSLLAERATLAKFYGKYPISYPIVIVCAFALQLLCIWLIARKRQNWLRWTSLVLLVLMMPYEILSFGARFRDNAAWTTAYYAALVIWLVAVLLLFRRDAREWFSDQRSAPDVGQPS